MSHYSGFSSASRIEIEKLNEEKANIEAKMAAEMAEKDKKLAALQALLVASGLVGVNMEPGQGTSAQAQEQEQTRERQLIGGVNTNMDVTITPSRKRHSSQQLERVAKVAGGVNRFEVLTQAASYPDETMRPGSVVSTPGFTQPSI